MGGGDGARLVPPAGGADSYREMTRQGAEKGLRTAMQAYTVGAPCVKDGLLAFDLPPATRGR